MPNYPQTFKAQTPNLADLLARKAATKVPASLNFPVCSKKPGGALWRQALEL